MSRHRKNRWVRAGFNDSGKKEPMWINRTRGNRFTTKVRYSNNMTYFRKNGNWKSYNRKKR